MTGIEMLRDAVTEIGRLFLQRDDAVKSRDECQAQLDAANKRIEELTKPTIPTPAGWRVEKVEDFGSGSLDRISVYGRTGEDWPMTNRNPSGVWAKGQVTLAENMLVVKSSMRDENTIKGGAFGWYAHKGGPFRLTARLRISRRDYGHGVVLQGWGTENDKEGGRWAMFPEYDLFERYPTSGETAEANIHFNPGKKGDKKFPRPGKLKVDWTVWHEYSLECTEDRVAFSCDGEVYMEAGAEWADPSTPIALVVQNEAVRKPNVSAENWARALAGQSETQIDWLRLEVPV